MFLTRQYVQFLIVQDIQLGYDGGLGNNIKYSLHLHSLMLQYLSEQHDPIDTTTVSIVI